MFYDLASKMAKDWLRTSGDTLDIKIKRHDFANSILSGFGKSAAVATASSGFCAFDSDFICAGNTFSDIVGIIYGSVILKGVEHGMGVAATFWPLDIFFMFIGCLLGFALPSMLSRPTETKGTYAALAMLSFALIVGSLGIAAVPHWSGWTQVICAWSTFGSAMVIGLGILIWPLVKRT